MKKYGTLLSIILTIIFGSVYYYLFYQTNKPTIAADKRETKIPESNM